MPSNSDGELKYDKMHSVCSIFFFLSFFYIWYTFHSIILVVLENRFSCFLMLIDVTSQHLWQQHSAIQGMCVHVWLSHFSTPLLIVLVNSGIFLIPQFMELSASLSIFIYDKKPLNISTYQFILKFFYLNDETSNTNQPAK